MPTGNLPAGAKKIFTAAEAQAKKTTCKDSGDRMDECAAKVAWSAVKKKYKKVGDKWIPKAELSTFSMAFTSTSYDKASDTRRWKAVASDTKDDLYNDNMTLELFADFVSRIESKESPPESFRSDFWDGGMPYLSISHYPDFNGKGVPGPVDTIYVDGNKLKSTGRFFNTPIGMECFKSISKDLSDNIPDDEKIRISIAFLDWMHRHKSNGYLFDRAKSEEPICPECLKELITGKSKGKEFLKGHLVHLALTRVPVNTRTSMEVERSDMTTRKEDAASIVTEELAEDLEEQATLEGKSLAVEGDPQVVIKAEDVEPEVEEKREKASDYVDKEKDDDEEEEEKEKMKEKKSDVEEPDKIDLALHLLEEIKADLKPAPAHPLDVAVSELKSAYDEAIQMDNPEEAMVIVNESYEGLVAVIQNGLAKDETNDTVSESKELSELKAFVTEQFGLINSKLSTITSQPQQVIAEQDPNFIPQRRSVSMGVNPNLFMQPKEEVKSETPKLRDLARKSVGLVG